jgi:predicted PurR-regulated permease PerM
MARNLFRMITALPSWAKIPIYVITVLLALVTLVLVVMLSPFLAIMAFLVLLIAVSTLISRAIRHLPFRRVGLVALSSLIVLIAFSGVSYAIYPEIFTKQFYEEAEQARLEEARSEAEVAAEAEEEAKLAEEAKVEKEARLEEEARLAEEAKAQEEAQVAELGIWGLSTSEQDQLSGDYAIECQVEDVVALID